MAPKGNSSRDKYRKGKDRDIPDHTLTLRDRLQQALSLGIKSDGKGEKKWQSTDVAISGHAVRAISAFSDSISSDLFQHPLIKESISDVFLALEGILQLENVTVLKTATKMSTKLIASLGRSICHYHISGVVFCLSRLLSYHQLEVAISSAMSLKCILMNISIWKHGGKEIWAVFEETNAIESLSHVLERYGDGSQSLEFLKEVISLLREITCRWPLSRYPVWSNSKLMARLGTLCATSDPSVTTGVLQLYKALAMEFLKSKEHIVPNMVQCMGSSMHRNIRIEALALCQHLMRSEKGCLLLTSLSCEPVIRGIVNAMGGWRSPSTRRVPSDQMPLVMEACRAALITRWPGEHHYYFWKSEIVTLLLDLILGNHGKVYKPKDRASFKELRDAAFDNTTDVRNITWDILGGLAMHCEEDFFSRDAGKVHCLDVLICCACSVALEAMLIQRSSSHRPFNPSEIEPVSRALLLLVFSPCKYIAIHTKKLLSEALGDDDSSDYLECLLDFLRLNAFGDCKVAPDNVRLILSLIALAIYSSLPEYQSLILRKGGLRTLIAIVKRCLSNDIHISRSIIASHLHNSSNTRRCCTSHNLDEEGENIVLLYSLQALSQIICLSDFARLHRKMTPGDVSVGKQNEDSEAQVLFGFLQEILNNDSLSRGIKWYSAYCLSFFGVYGFPSMIGKRMEKALDGNEFADLQLILSDQQSLGVHGVVLMDRCPSLLPLKESLLDHGSLEKEDFKEYGMEFRREVRLSNCVSRDALVKLLKYVYTGFCQVDDDLVKPMRFLAKRCGLKSLQYMFELRPPMCGSVTPRCKFTKALGTSGHLFSDIILEAKETVEAWTCSVCQLSMPHIHAHRIILCSSSEYLQALFQSGMQDSSSHVMRVPVSWKALEKLVWWFYSGELPKLSYCCTWVNMDKKMQLDELSVYVELSWLAEYWCLDEVQEESLGVVVPLLEMNQNFPVKIIELARNLGQHKIVEVAVNHLAPFYPQLRDSKYLEDLDEDVINLLREEYVRYSQYDHRPGD